MVKSDTLEEKPIGGNVMKDGYNQGDMKPVVKDYQSPERTYSQMYDQATTDYISRQDKICEKESGKLRNEKFKGRYTK